MARNEEKSNSILNKWVAMRSEHARGTTRKRRPFIASECHNLPDAEAWRLDVIRDISRKVSDIQNAGLGEHRLRELNDEINKLFREKRHWERQILELGGPNHAARSAAVSAEAEGVELPGSGGYRYFGAAKSLPGVRELFDVKQKRSKKRSRGEIQRRLTVDYFGWRDEDDTEMLREEAAAEGRMRAQAVAEWHAARAAGLDPAEADGGAAAGSSPKKARAAVTEADLAAMRAEAGSGASADVATAAAPLPSEEEIRRRLVAKRKELLLRKYAPEAVA